MKTIMARAFHIVVFIFLAWWAGRLAAGQAEAKKLAEHAKEIAGSAEFLRSVPKHFAIIKAVNAAHGRVTLLVEGEVLAKEWSLAPDAEIKVAGWWGRLDDFTLGDRVWVWFKTDRKKQPAAISMLADELSEQDIHGPGVTIQGPARGKDRIEVIPVKGRSRTLRLLPKTTASAGPNHYVQSAAGMARLILDKEQFAARRSQQKTALRKRWLAEGLPGTISFVHVFSGEMDLMLDHEALRWGRSLNKGDKVRLRADPPIQAVVKDVRPWRERTQVRLVVHSLDAADLAGGQRIHLVRPAPPAQVDADVFPPLPAPDRPRFNEERMEWFLASIYCTCGIDGDTCTGHFYTLASCNPNGCGMPNAMRRALVEKMNRGLSDRQILEELVKERGPDILRPHLLP
jgi:hypothetical protein